MNTDPMRFQLRENASDDASAFMALTGFGNFVFDENLNQHSHIDPMDENLPEAVGQLFRNEQHPFMFQ